MPARDASRAAKTRALEEPSVVRELGLPISSHVSGAAGQSQLEWLVENGVLGPDMLLVHATDAPPNLLDAVAQAGAAIALTPITEQRVGFGLTRISDYQPVAVSISLGIDGALAGAPNMFTVMKMLHNVEVGASGDELAVLPRRLLERATIGGAKAVGLSDRIRSLELGNSADMILVDTEAVNMGPVENDPSALLVYSVIVAGRWRKRQAP